VQHMLRMCRSAAFRRQQHLVNIPAAAGARGPDLSAGAWNLKL
jgi:hypothetical protein